MNDEFAARLASVRQRVRSACERAGRTADDVRLMAVTKTFGPSDVRMAAAAGLTAMGESRVREAAEKIPQCPPGLEWHMVGHLQRNKARDAVNLFEMIHSVDSPALLDVLERVCGEARKTMPVCLEVNVSGEESKFGVTAAGVAEMLAYAAGLVNVKVVGLMTIPPYADDPEASRPFFRRLRELRDECRQHSGVRLSELSMGMSHDFEIAVEEGATWVRLGTILFGRREAGTPA